MKFSLGKGNPIAKRHITWKANNFLFLKEKDVAPYAFLAFRVNLSVCFPVSHLQKSVFCLVMLFNWLNWKIMPKKHRLSLSRIYYKANFMIYTAMLEIDEPNRIWGEKCTRGDILINQGPSAPLPSGIPAFTVDIMNRCGTGCNISGIHLTCGWFSSDHLINPKIFKRLRYNDCLVNDGKPLLNGATLTFVYANTFPYPLSVSSILCSWNFAVI